MGADGRWSGDIIKIEQVLVRGLDGGARLHVWLGPDPRPHNHPWEWINCKVIRGSYTAIEYIPHNGTYVEATEVLSVGEPEHCVEHDIYHQIVKVEPGTISIMTFGPVVGDGKQWGHLKKQGKRKYTVELAQPDSAFVDALRHCNPHLRPAGWVNPYEGECVPTLADFGF